VHGGRVANDVLEAISIAHLGTKLGVFLQKLFLLPHHDAVKLNGLGEESGDDFQEVAVALKLFLGAGQSID